ncbi:MAG: 2-amino-4-hydroxy-6-hydroxymethyldihydropteridine diphosphokinase [Candidatus Eisenbacteria bacterium]
MTRVHLGIGSNLGDRLEHLRRALRALETGPFRAERVSPVFETAPVGPVPDQPRFLNCVARGTFEGGARDLLELIRRVETELGRAREVPKGPRTIDVDILYFGEERIDEPPDLVIPHPEIPNRRFVLRPLAEIDPDLVHPGIGKTQAELLLETADGGEVSPFPGDC